MRSFTLPFVQPDGKCKLWDSETWEFETTPDAIYDTDGIKHAPFDWGPLTMTKGVDFKHCLEIEFGCLSVIQAYAKILKTPTPNLDRLLTQRNFHQALRDIIAFHSCGEVPLSAVDAFAYLRLAAYGGGMRKWSQGVNVSGRFITQGGETIGSTTTKDVQRCELVGRNGGDGGFMSWPRPQNMRGVVTELETMGDAIKNKNPDIVHHLCEGNDGLVIDDNASDSQRRAVEYTRTSTTVGFILQTIMFRIVEDTFDTLIARGLIAVVGGVPQVRLLANGLQFDTPDGDDISDDALKGLNETVREGLGTSGSYFRIVRDVLQAPPASGPPSAVQEFLKKRKAQDTR